MFSNNLMIGIHKRSIVILLFVLILFFLTPFPVYASTKTITYDYYDTQAVKSALFITETSQTQISYSYDNSGNLTERTIDTSPDTTITENPSNPSNSSTASFSFTSTKANSTFQCKLNNESYSSCTSPKEYTGLSDDSHTFMVFATCAHHQLMIPKSELIG